MSVVDPLAFLNQGLRYMNLEHHVADVEARFKAHFGSSPYICSMVWTMIVEAQASQPVLPNNASFVHLLWALLLMKVYASEAVLSGIVGADQKTFRKWSWLLIRKVATLKDRVVSRRSKLVTNFWTQKNITHSHPFRSVCQNDLLDKMEVLAYSQLMVRISVFTNRSHSGKAGTALNFEGLD